MDADAKKTALRMIPYGLYVLTAESKDGKVAAAGALVGAVMVYLAITAIQVWLTSRASDPHRVQAIVVMGAAQYDGRPSPDLAARLSSFGKTGAEHVLRLPRARVAGSAAALIAAFTGADPATVTGRPSMSA